MLVPTNYTPNNHVVFDFGGAGGGSNANYLSAFGFCMILNNTTQFHLGSNGYVTGAVTGGTANSTTYTSSTFTLPSSNVFNDGNWHHYVITLQSTNASNGASTLVLYYDGNAIQTINNFQYPYNNTPMNGDLYLPWWCFGGGVNNGNYFTAYGIQCYFDNIRAYTRIINSSEINTLFTTGS